MASATDLTFVNAGKVMRPNDVWNIDSGRVDVRRMMCAGCVAVRDDVCWLGAGEMRADDMLWNVIW